MVLKSPPEPSPISFTPSSSTANVISISYPSFSPKKSLQALTTLSHASSTGYPKTPADINGNPMEFISFSFAKCNELRYALYKTSSSPFSPPDHLGPTACITNLVGKSSPGAITADPSSQCRSPGSLRHLFNPSPRKIKPQTPPPHTDHYRQHSPPHPHPAL